MRLFYLAGPFFKPEQIHVLEEIEQKADELGLSYFSPRRELHCPPGAPFEERTKAFVGNCSGIQNAEFVLARIDDFDPGTVWELGYAFGVSKSRPMGAPKKMYAFTTVEGRGLNLMLAQSCDGFLQGMPAVLAFLEDQAIGVGDGRAKQWLKDVI